MDHLRYQFCHSCGLTVAFVIFYAEIFSYFNLVIFPRLVKPFLTDFTPVPFPFLGCIVFSSLHPNPLTFFQSPSDFNSESLPTGGILCR